MRHRRWEAARPHAARTSAAPVLVVLGTAAVLLVSLTGPHAFAAATRAGSVVTGTVERVMPDHFGATTADSQDVLTYISTETGAVEVAGAALASVPTGATVAVHLADTAPTAEGPVPAVDGEGVDQGATVTQVQVTAGVGADSVATGAGTARSNVEVAQGRAAHEVTVVVADLPGAPRSKVTAAQVAATVNGGVNNYWSTVTGGKVTFHATPYQGSSGDGHVTTTTSPCSAGNVTGSFAFWNEVAADVNFTDGAGKDLLVYFDTSKACSGIAGLATLGGSVTGGDLSGGGRVWTDGYDRVDVIGHELGHNLGLGHSQELRCGTAVDANVSHCTKLVYNDLADIMGLSWGDTGYLNAVHLQWLGLLPRTDIENVTSSRALTLRPLSTGSGLRVAQLHYGGSTYVLEDRARTGLDGWLGTTYGTIGVTVRKVLDPATTNKAEFPARESLLLDGDPSTSDALTGPAGYRTVLPVGSWVPLAAGHLGIRVDAVGAGGATVSLRVGGLTAATAPAAARATPAQARVHGGVVQRRAGFLRLPATWRWTVSPPGVSTGRVERSRATVAATASWRTSRYATTTRVKGAKVRVHGTVQARYIRESAASYRGGWRTSRTRLAIGGRERIAEHAGAMATMTVTGRSIGVIARRAPHRGKIAIYVDGRRVAVVRLSAHNPGGPQVVWSASFHATGQHVVQVVRLGARGAGFDGLLLLR